MWSTNFWGDSANQGVKFSTRSVLEVQEGRNLSSLLLASGSQWVHDVLQVSPVWGSITGAGRT